MKKDKGSLMRRSEIAVVYIAGLAQGLALVVFPAASSIFTSSHEFGFSFTEYGNLFLPQSILAIGASLFSTKLSQRCGLKFVFLLGLAANFLSMALLAVSAIVMSHKPIAYSMLLLATANLGIGFGLLVPSVNTFATLFFPKKVDSAVLLLNALLGAGTTLAPVFIMLFVGFGIWWALPLLLLVLFLGLLLASFSLPLHSQKESKAQVELQSSTIPTGFWVFGAFALLYGIVETLNGNWATLYMKKTLQASASVASLALSFFWGFVTLGRLFFASIEKFFSEDRVLQILPLVIALSFIIIASQALGNTTFAVFGFALSGLGCSACLPLIISFGAKAFPSIATTSSGLLIASYLLGYGIAAFGAGPLQDFVDLSLTAIYGVGVIVALTLGFMAFLVIQKVKPSFIGKF